MAFGRPLDAISDGVVHSGMKKEAFGPRVFLDVQGRLLSFLESSICREGVMNVSLKHLSTSIYFLS